MISRVLDPKRLGEYTLYCNVQLSEGTRRDDQRTGKIPKIESAELVNGAPTKSQKISRRMTNAGEATA
jgi:hypothetical protein